MREDDSKERVLEDQIEFYNALQYLANFHLRKGQLDDAYTFAYKCMEYEEVRSHHLIISFRLSYFFADQGVGKGFAKNYSCTQSGAGHRKCSHG